MKLTKMHPFTTWASAAIASLGCACLYGQGTLLFSNLGPEVDAPVSYLDGSRVGPEMTAQIYAAPAGSSLSELRPVFPSERFLEGEFKGYVFGGVLAVPEIMIGEEALIVLRAFSGESWETSLCRGESNPITIRLAGDLGLDTPLHGMEPFTVVCIPEPGAMALALFGGVLARMGSIRTRGKT